MPNRTLITVRQVAEILGVSEASVYTYFRRGVKINGESFVLTRYGSRARRMALLAEVQVIRKAWDADEPEG